MAANYWAVMRVLCVFLCLSVSMGHETHKMNKTLKSLFSHYKVSNRVRMSGSPVFPVDLLKDTQIEVGEKKVLMGGVLKVYEKLIAQMLAKSAGGQSGAGDSPNGSGQEGGTAIELRYVKGEVEDLLKLKYHESTSINEQLLSLQNIQTNDTLIQNKALRELPWLYEQASHLVQSRGQQARRRRQALRTKTLKLKRA